MKRVLALLGLAVCLVVAVAGNSQAAGADYGRIMPVGDSITVGGCGTNAGYRGFLYDALTSDGSTVRFVGTNTENPGRLPAGQRQHDGRNGWATSDVRGTAAANGYNDLKHGNIGRWLDKLSSGNDSPDIITMMIGTNDVGLRGLTVNQSIVNLSAIIDTIYDKNPEVELLLAKVIPIQDNPGRSAWIKDFNARLPALIAAKNNTMRVHRIFLVDMNTGFPGNGLADRLHPNDVGYRWMADKWKEAVTALVRTKGMDVQAMRTNNPCRCPAFTNRTDKKGLIL